MTLDVWDTRVINGASTTGWFPANTLTIGSFTGDIQKEGTLYEIDSLVTQTVDTDEILIGFSFTRLMPDGVTVDTTWSGFQNENTISNATIELSASEIVGGWLGWFPVCPLGETTSLIEWDITTPNGFGKINNDGGIEGRSRQIQYQIRLLMTITLSPGHLAINWDGLHKYILQTGAMKCASVASVRRIPPQTQWT